MVAYGGGSWLRVDRRGGKKPTYIIKLVVRSGFQDTRGLSSNWLVTAAEQPVSQW